MAARSGTPARDGGGLRQRSVLRVAAELARPTMRPSLAADIAGPASIAADAAHLPAAPDRPARAAASSHQRLNPSPSTSAARDRRGPESRRNSGGGRWRPLPSCVFWPSKLLAASTLVAARYRYWLGEVELPVAGRTRNAFDSGGVYRDIDATWTRAWLRRALALLGVRDMRV